MRLHVPIRIRWSDLDAYAHVNNAAMLSLLEEARIVAFWETDEIAEGAIGASTAVLDGRPGASTLTLIAHQEVEYLLPIPFQRHPLDVQLWIGRLGGASLEVCYEVHSPAETGSVELYARASTSIVLVDAQSQRPRRITSRERDAWAPYLEEPVQMRRRS